jgi:iron complex outermembrane receptor protein
VTSRRGGRSCKLRFVVEVCRGWARLVRVNLAWLLLAPGVSLAQHAELDALASPGSLEQVDVIATTPLPGTAIDADKIPANVDSVKASDLTREGSASLTGALNGRLGSINISDTLADPFQPDLIYRGFYGSAVLGTPEGLAVYQNGVRINEAFGDAVNWDLIPDIAIDRVDVVSANPVYGLNALGGAASISMKNGFSYQGADAELAGGSFRLRSGEAQLGAKEGDFGFYAAGKVLDENGWRFFAHDHVRQFYTALSRHSDALTLDLSYTHDDNQLFGQGAAPVQSLAVDSRNVFTGPQANLDRLNFVTLNASLALPGQLSVQGALYYRDYQQIVANGNTTDFTACTDATLPGALCQSDAATPLRNSAGQPLPDISNGGAQAIGENDSENIHSRGFGGSVQLTGQQSMGSYQNRVTAGISADAAHIDFSTGTQIGVIDPTLTVLNSQLVVDTPEDTGFDATPVLLRADSRYYGFFLTDTLDVTQGLSVTLSARYNVAQLDLFDQRGTDLDGLNRYTHFNPALGATYKILPNMTAYAGFSTTNRAPTASEIECSDPLRPCLLPANLAGDPPTLKQVIAHTFELGLRGHLTGLLQSDDALQWKFGLFHTALSDDLFAVSTSLSTGFFENVGATRREGGQADLGYHWNHGAAYFDYSYVAATFRSSFALNAPSNPFADEGGDIFVHPGDRLPGIPLHRIKLGGDYELRSNWVVGATGIYVSSSFYKGDESNQSAPLPGYAVLNLHSSCTFWRKSQLFLTLNNVFNRHYATFGVYSDPTGVGAPGVPAGADSNDPGVDNRFQSPAAPRSIFGGVRVSF